jgi:DNA-binding transcriptional LysR family regulator
MLHIHSVNISAANLNHLVAFHVLLAERNVTRAARRIGVTQSAMSNALRQLRTMFDDPLFVRRSSGIEPTARALALADPIARGIASFEAALAPAVFDPRTAERTFVVAASDYVEMVLLPALLPRLAREAPAIRLETVPWGLHDVPDTLARGDAELMLGYYGRLPARHHEQLLFDEEFVCIARRGHPTLGRRPTLKAWLATPHVVVSQKPSQMPGSASSVDRALAARGLSRTIGTRVSHFSVVPHVVAKTDFTAALSRRIAEPAARALRLVTFAPPLRLPTGHIGQVWHDRLDNDAGHCWLRAAIADVASNI